MYNFRKLFRRKYHPGHPSYPKIYFNKYFKRKIDDIFLEQWGNQHTMLFFIRLNSKVTFQLTEGESQ